MIKIRAVFTGIWQNKKHRTLLLIAILLFGGLVDSLLNVEAITFGRYEIHGLRLVAFIAGLLFILFSVVTLFKSWRFLLEEALPFAAIISPFAFWVTNRTIRLDFWYDELVTFNRFVFVPLRVTLTDYTFPNNHIFHNLLNNLYLKIAGISQLTTLMDHPSFIRYLMLLYAVIALVYVYLAGRQFVSKWAGLFSVLILSTTIPFFNFAVQVRGYGLSITLAAALLFHWWRSQQSSEKVPYGHLAAYTAAGALLIYTIPSNIYLPASLAAWNLLDGGWRLIRGELKPLTLKTLLRQFALALASLAALGLALLLYSPVLSTVMNNSVVNTRGLFNWVILTKLLPRVMGHFVSTRWLLVALALAGLALLFTRATRREHPGAARLTGALTFVLLAPFVFSFARGDPSFERIYLVHLPTFSLLVGIGLHLLIQRLPRGLRQPGWALTLLSVYAAVIFSGQVLRNEALTRQNNASGIGTQGTYTNFYLVDFVPDRLMREFFSQQDELAHEFYIYKLGDNAAAREYSAKYFGYYPSSVESLEGFQGTFFILTAFPNQFLAQARAQIPGITCTRLNSVVWYQNIFLCDAGASP